MIFSNGALKGTSSANNGVAGLSIGTLSTDNYGAGDGFPGVITQSVPFAQLPNMEICQIQVLPVTITDFNAAYVSSNNVKVSWSTTNEINASYYVVERSTNAEDFIPVGQVNMSQSLNPVHNYNLNDQLYNVNSNIVYYRLRIVDNSGKFSYSRVVPVKLDQQVTGFSLYPNPIDNYTILNLFSDKQSMGVLRVMDNSGRQILTKSGGYAHPGTVRQDHPQHPEPVGVCRPAPAWVGSQRTAGCDRGAGWQDCRDLGSAAPQ